MTNWYIWTPVLCSAAWGVGIIMGLSMGFYFGTRRSVLLFMRYFPTTETMNKRPKVSCPVSST